MIAFLPLVVIVSLTRQLAATLLLGNIELVSDHGSDVPEAAAGVEIDWQASVVASEACRPIKWEATWCSSLYNITWRRDRCP